MAVPMELSDRDSLIKSAATLFNSMVVSQYSSLLAPIAVDAVLPVVDPAHPDLVELRDVKIVKKLGGTVDDTELVKDSDTGSSSGSGSDVKAATPTKSVKGHEQHGIGMSRENTVHTVDANETVSGMDHEERSARTESVPTEADGCQVGKNASVMNTVIDFYTP